MRLVLISDTHSLHDDMKYRVEDLIKPEVTNILIHAGDCTNVGRKHEVEDFVNWYKNIKGFKKKILIPGNHDMTFEVKEDWYEDYMNEENLSQSDVIYLLDSEFILEDSEFSRPIKFYGSPWQPEFYNWGFNLPRNGQELEVKWKNIPDDTDVLITHGPPFSILDYNPQNVSCGCELLRLRLGEINPLVHVFGHIHHSYGIKYFKDIAMVNASICTEQYNPTNKPIVIDIIKLDESLMTFKYDYE